MSFEVVAFGQGRWATEFSQTKSRVIAVILSVNQWNGHCLPVDDDVDASG